MSFWNDIKIRLKTMGIIRNAIPNESILALEEVIVKKSINYTELLDKYIKESTPQGNQEYLQKRIEVYYENVCFFCHIASRIIFNKYGPSKRQIMNDKLGPILVNFTISHFYKSISQDSSAIIPNKFKEGFYGRLNEAEYEYSLCKAMILKTEDDVSYADKIAAGIKSKGTINLWADNIVNQLNTKNPITHILIMKILVSNFDIKEFEKIVINAARNI